MIPFLSTLAAHYIIVLFLFLNLAIGFWAHTKAKSNSFEDYALASRSLPTGVLVMTLLGTILSITTLCNTGDFYYYGVLTTGRYFCTFLGFLFVGTLIAPCLVYFDGAITLGDLMRRFYGDVAQLLTGIVGCIVCLLAISAQINAIGAMSEYLLGMSSTSAVLCFGILVILYSIFGGMRSVSYTDVLQGIIALGVLSWMAQTVIIRVGGGQELFRVLSKKHPEKLMFFSHPKLVYKIKSNLFWSLFCLVSVLSPPIVQRMLITKNKLKVRRAWYMSSIFYLIVVTLLLVIGIASIVGEGSEGIFDLQEYLQLFRKRIDAKITATTFEDLVPYLVKRLFQQTWAIDVFFIGIASILFSTIDSYLHAVGVLFVQDIWEPIRTLSGLKALGSKKKGVYARLGVAVIGILSLILGCIKEEGGSWVNDIFFDYAHLIYTLIVIPLIFGIIGIKTDKLSWASFCGVYLSVMVGLRLGMGVHKYDSFIIAVLFAILAYFATHIYQNGGIVTLKRSELTIAEQLWLPTWQGTVKYMKSWLLAPFQLHTLASRKIVDNPTHPLSFSMLIFALYTFSSVMTGGGNDLGVANFMAGIHMIGITLCAGLMLEGIWPTRIKPYFALYWFFTLFYCLAFGSTLAFLRAHGDTMAVGKWIFNFMLLAALVDSMSFVTLACLGSGLAMALWYGVFGSIPADLLGSIGLLGVYLLFGLLVIVLLFECSKEKGLKERLYIKNAFSHAITHESTQPLSEISVLSTLQQRAIDELSPMQNAQGEKGFWIPASKQGMLQKGSQQIGKAVQEIKHEFGRFNKLIEDEISTLEKEKVSMQSLIESIVPTLPKKHTNRIKVKVECTKDFKASVMRPLFANVFANLLKNAYLHGNATQMHIHIEGGKRKLSIRDNGSGIKVEALPRIFELHFTTGGQTSNGVGLALVKSIVQASGGKISCHSRHGDKDSFTAFVIEFPEG